jgi:hypothetical protein
LNIAHRYYLLAVCGKMREVKGAPEMTDQSMRSRSAW